MLALCALTGCTEGDFPLPETVEKDRVLAGSIVVPGESRVTPALGERARYELLVSSPGAQVQWTYLLAVCHFLRDANGAPFCDASLPLIAASGAEPSLATPPLGLPGIDFVVPSAENLREDEGELLLQGIVCPGGPIDAQLLAAIAAQDFSVLAEGRNPCADKSKNGVLLATPFVIERSEQDRNHAPRIDVVTWSQLEQVNESVVLGAPWLARALAQDAQENCQGKGFPEVYAKQRIGFQLQLDDAARETYLDPSPVPGAEPRSRVEIPQVQGLSSAGKFEIVRDNQLEAGQLLQLEWSLPKRDPGPNGLLVRFWFIATDDRANDTQATSWEERALCVLRPEEATNVVLQPPAQD
jgi:hypothetical protein